MTYDVTCKLARQRGAIGMFYPITATFQADTTDAAIGQFRERYETNGPPVTALAVCPNCGQYQREPSRDCLHECRRRGFVEASPIY